MAERRGLKNKSKSDPSRRPESPERPVMIRPQTSDAERIRPPLRDWTASGTLLVTASLGEPSVLFYDCRHSLSTTVIKEP